MAKRRTTRWADGDTRDSPFVFIRKDELSKLGVELPNPACIGDLIDADELARLRESARVNPQTPGKPPTGKRHVAFRFISLVLFIIGWHIVIAVIVWFKTRK